MTKMNTVDAKGEAYGTLPCVRQKSLWETAAGLGAVTNFARKTEKDGSSFVSYIKGKEKIFGVTPEMGPTLVQQ